MNKLRAIKSRICVLDGINSNIFIHIHIYIYCIYGKSKFYVPIRTIQRARRARTISKDEKRPCIHTYLHSEVFRLGQKCARRALGTVLGTLIFRSILYLNIIRAFAEGGSFCFTTAAAAVRWSRANTTATV